MGGCKSKGGGGGGRGDDGPPASLEEAGYKVGRELGQGGFAIVKEGTAKVDGSKWALKMIDMKTYTANKKQTDDEVKILSKLKHHGIVEMREVVKTSDKKQHFVIVLELLSGGELFDRIVAREKFTEDDAKGVTKMLLDTIKYLHDNKCVHRDLKPENLIYKTQSDDSPLKLTDFGFAAFYERSGELKQSCGTPEYVAPEILLDAPYGEKCDLWSVGVIVYILLCGFPPFFAETDDELFDKIGSADFVFTLPYWSTHSEAAKDFIMKLLVVDPNSRLSADEALAHEWLTGTSTGGTLDAISNLKKFNSTRKLRKAVNAVIATNRFTNVAAGPEGASVSEVTDEDRKEYKESFNLFDTDSNGGIDSDELMNALNHVLWKTSKFTPSDAKAILDKWDMDKNGEIDLDEFCIIMKLSQKSGAEDIKNAFDVFDEDGDGTISEDEIRKTMKNVGVQITKEDLKLIMDDVDTDKSGQVDLDEFKVMMSHKPKAS